MRYVLLFLILIGSVTSAAAQTSTKTELVPPLADDYFPERWKEFRSEGWYRVLFPGTPKESFSKLPLPDGEVLVHKVVYESVISYNVLSTQYPHEIEKQSKIKGFMDQLRDASLAAVASGKPRVVNESDITVDGHPGRILQVEFANNTVVRFKWIAVKNRVYVVHISTPKGKIGIGGVQNDYEKIAVAFMESFRLLP